MSKYQLLPNEHIILRKESGGYNIEEGELILTNLHLVHVTSELERGFLSSKVKEVVKKYPVGQIKVFDGKAQVSMESDSGASGSVATITVYFINGDKLVFEFYEMGKKAKKEKLAEIEAAKWLNEINKLVTGVDMGVSVNVNKNTVLPGTEMLASVVGGTVDVFKDALGLKPKKQNEALPVQVSNKCKFCGAPIPGTAGKTVRCRYCDADQQI